MSHRTSTSKRVNKRLGRKAFRAAERRLLRGGHARRCRTMSYWTPASLRKNKLPVL